MALKFRYVALLACLHFPVHFAHAQAFSRTPNEEYAKGNYARAFRGFFEQATRSNDPNVQFNLGMMYERGQGTDQNDVEAVKWYSRAVDQGSVPAMRQLAGLMAAGRSIKQDGAGALALLRKAIEQNDVAAIEQVAGMYFEGRGVPADQAQAKQWYQKAAAAGSKSAQEALDLIAAMERQAAGPLAPIRKRAVTGDANAQYDLAVAYHTGNTVPKDPAQALEWYLKAAAQGHAMAQFYAGLLYSNGDGVAQDLAQARAWFSKAAAQDNKDAATNLAVMLDLGKGGPVDLAQAAVVYQQAAKLGSAQAQVRLAGMYWMGQGVKKDYIQAATYYRQAAEQGKLLLSASWSTCSRMASAQPVTSTSRRSGPPSWNNWAAATDMKSPPGVCWRAF